MNAKKTLPGYRSLRELLADDPIYTRGFIIGAIRSAKPLPSSPAAKQSAPLKKPVSR